MWPLAVALFQVTIPLWSSIFYKQKFPEKATPVLASTLQGSSTNQNFVIVGSWNVTNPESNHLGYLQFP